MGDRSMGSKVVPVWGRWTMKAITVELPDKLAAEVESYVKAGWFGSEAEVIRAALMGFVRRNRVDLLEQFMRDDIEWALRQKASLA
jgi:Arc/MetJ-type ribon-helix-helix transcriptional regulator